jgi:assimilatory nitrate reductase catalytic subunit
MAETKSTCCYCGVGCGVIVESHDGLVTGVRGDPDHPANFGRLCTKGATLHLTARQDSRALHPELRADRATPRSRASWDTALDHAADRFAAVIRAGGPDAVGFYLSGQLLTEDYYVFNKLARALVGTNNIDTNSRLCMSSAVAGYKLTLGADAPPACYEDIDHADLFLVAGSNAAWAHPVLFRRIEDARARDPQAKLVVVDPRRTDTAAAADLHLAIRPGTDIALLNALLHVLVAEGFVDRAYVAAHTEGFDALERTVREYAPRTAARICGLDADQIVAAARWFGRARAALSLYCQGLNQSTHGTHNNAAIVNLHLATGQIGRPGAGPFSLTGQPNAMGGREVGGMATLLPGHRDPADPAHRAEVAALWEVPELPARPGRTAVEMFEAVARGEIRALWIACTNPAQSLPDQRLVRAALGRAELVVVQEAYRDTDTAAFADVLLPAASWAEKEGTVTNSERRITRVRAAVPPPGEARADWAIAADFALRLGARLGRADVARRFGWSGGKSGPAAIFDEHRATTLGRDLDIGGLDYARLEREGPQQWPLPAGASAGRARLYADGVFPTASGRARFADTRHLEPAEAPDARHPLLLNTGRLRDQWHGMSRTGTVAQLFGHTPRPALDMHPDDLAARALRPGDLARVASRRGELVVPVQASADLRPGQVYLPMHWGSRFMRGAGANALTVRAFDPFSKQPELKLAAVEVTKVDLPYRVAALARLEPGVADALVPLLECFACATLVPFGRDERFVELDARDCRAPDAGTLAALDAALGFAPGVPGPAYADPARAVGKRIRFAAGRIAAVRLAGETRAAAWLREAMLRGAADAASLRRLALAPIEAPPAAGPARGRVVCNCYDVSEDEIARELAAARPLGEVQARLKCGTECGSCLPELRRLAAAAGASARAVRP